MQVYEANSRDATPRKPIACGERQRSHLLRHVTSPTSMIHDLGIQNTSLWYLEVGSLHDKHSYIGAATQTLGD